MNHIVRRFQSIQQAGLIFFMKIADSVPPRLCVKQSMAADSILFLKLNPVYAPGFLLVVEAATHYNPTLAAEFPEN